MNRQLDESFVSEIRIPKTLVKQAAEAVALNIVSVSIPIIETVTYKRSEETSEDEKETSKDVKNSMLDKLKRLKRWYWKDTGKCLGDCDSELRCIISKSLLEVIEMSENVWRSELLHKFMVQLLFSCEAGNLGVIYPTLIEESVSRQFSKLLLYIAPFYIRELHDESFLFAENFPFNFIILNSVDLRRLRLHRNIKSSSLDRLRISCRKAEIITFDLEKDGKYSDLVKDDNIFRVFFENRERSFVCQQMAYRNAVPTSFPNLKEVCFRCDHILLSLTLFFQCLLYSYSKVKITVSCLASVPHDGFLLKYPFVCPTFQVVRGEAEEKITCVYFYNEDLELNGTTEVSQTLVSDANMFRHIFTVFACSTYNMQDILSLIQVCNLKYIFSDEMKIEVSPSITLNADKLRVLYVLGSFSDEKTDRDLVESLNQCSGLEALFFKIKPMISPVLKGLSLLNSLKVLSIHFVAMQPCSEVIDSRSLLCLDTTLKEEQAGKFMELLITAAPNLEVLEAPCLEYFLTIISNGYLQKLITLCVTRGDHEIIKKCILNLSQLKYLLLDKFILYNDYAQLKRLFYYSKLQISYKRGRQVVQCIS